LFKIRAMCEMIGFSPLRVVFGVKKSVHQVNR
jgi:hypothetical protein